MWLSEFLFSICPSLQFEYQQAQLEAEIENLSWKVERADSYERGVVGGEGELSASDRGVITFDWIYSDTHAPLRVALGNF